MRRRATVRGYPDEPAATLVRPVRWRQTFTALHDARAGSTGCAFVVPGAQPAPPTAAAN